MKKIKHGGGWQEGGRKKKIRQTHWNNLSDLILHWVEEAHQLCFVSSCFSHMWFSVMQICLFPSLICGDNDNDKKTSCWTVCHLHKHAVMNGSGCNVTLNIAQNILFINTTLEVLKYLKTKSKSPLKMSKGQIVRGGNYYQINLTLSCRFIWTKDGSTIRFLN